MKKGIKELFIDELEDSLSSEKQIVKALPEMAKAAHSPELKKAFNDHLKETKNQVKRLEKVFKLLHLKSKSKFCKGTQGLIDEGKEAIKDFDKSPVRDAALISKAQRIEHYEIAAYGTLRTFASELSLKEVAALLEASLEEEGQADKTLTKIAQGGLFTAGINHLAHLEGEEKEKRKSSKKKTATKSKTPRLASKRTSSKSRSKKVSISSKEKSFWNFAKKPNKRLVAKSHKKKKILVKH